MRINLNWIKEFVTIVEPPERLAELLTMAGLEVEEVERVGRDYQGVVAGRILEVNPHPGSPNLFICQVDSGQGIVQVVCGAPNTRPGLTAPLALPGSRIAKGRKVGVEEIRGVKSEGILLAEDELGLTEDHSGIMELPPNTLPGTPLESALPLADWVFDIGLTPNRPDCASVIGIAREVAAITRTRLRLPEVVVPEQGPPVDEITSVSVLDPQGCPRYAARVIKGVKLQTSPFWLRYKLHLCGIRSINNVVDVTNYVLLEMGQPLHAFDLDRLRGRRIVVKRAEEGTIFTTLDGQSHRLGSHVLLIWDGERPVALAGIMGGLNSEIFEGTKDVLLESAYFDPTTIRRGCKSLGLSTESSYRFERGIDMEGVTRAIDRAASLILVLAGGKVAKGIIDVYPKRFAPPRIRIRTSRTNKILGTRLSGKVIKTRLQDLGMKVLEKGRGLYEVIPPSYRVDLQREVDLIEEVARMVGYQNVPVTIPCIRATEEGEKREDLLRDKIKEIMRGMGFSEVITYSFISPDSVELLDSGGEGLSLKSFVKIMNPLTREQSVMRTSLLPGLLSALRSNLARAEKGIKIFEWGKVFFHTENELPLEEYWVGACVCGLYRPRRWYERDRVVDFFDIKGAAELLLEGLGFGSLSFKRDARHPAYDPDLSARIFSQGKEIGRCGKILPRVLEAYEIEESETFFLELDVSALLEVMPEERRFTPIPKYPAVYRDLSIVLPKEVESEQVIRIIRQVGGELVEWVDIFDYFEGGKLAPQEKALAFRICYRSKEGTLEGEFVNQLHESIIKAIEEGIGGRLREA